MLIYFWRDWRNLLTSTIAKIRFGKNSFEANTLLPALIVGSIPAGIIGLLWQHEIEAILHNPASTLIPLALVGVALWLGDRYFRTHSKLIDLNLKHALIIGLAQAMALVPGTSRSGITILAGRYVGLGREESAKFSFLLGTPVMGGAALLNASDIFHSLGEPAFYLGCSVSMLVGCLTIAFLLRFLRTYGLGVFAVYRVILALILFFVLR